MARRRKQTLGLYVGSFNPFHIGHLDIARKAARIFDDVMIAQGINPNKEAPPPIPERIENFNCCEYRTHTPELVELFEELGNDVTLVRGIRGGYDLEYETAVQRAWLDKKPDLKIIMIRADAQHDHISSSLIRGLIPLDKVWAARYTL